MFCSEGIQDVVECYSVCICFYAVCCYFLVDLQPVQCTVHAWQLLCRLAVDSTHTAAAGSSYSYAQIVRMICICMSGLLLRIPDYVLNGITVHFGYRY